MLAARTAFARRNSFEVAAWVVVPRQTAGVALHVVNANARPAQRGACYEDCQIIDTTGPQRDWVPWGWAVAVLLQLKLQAGPTPGPTPSPVTWIWQCVAGDERQSPVSTLHRSDQTSLQVYPVCLSASGKPQTSLARA